ncbi:MAG TPA: hypothetical protein VIJ46_01365, partial [Rhabdochlamydiaceae bacterium]
TREAVMQMQIAHCILEAAFLDPQVLREVVQGVETANLQSPGPGVAESVHRATEGYFNAYAAAHGRCVWMLDQTVEFNTAESEKYRRIGQLETQFRRSITKASRVIHGVMEAPVIDCSLLGVLRDGIVKAEEKLKAALENAKRDVAALRATQRWSSGAESDQTSLYLTSPEALQDAQCLDAAILAVEQAYIALLEAGMEGMTVCGQLGIAPQFKILPRDVCVPVRFEAASVDKFYGPLLKIASLHMNDTKACVEIFEQRLNN